MKIHKITVLVVDFDNLGATDVKIEIENTNYPNDCIHPTVVEIDTREVEWFDGHPLDKASTRLSEFRRLFGAEGPK